jgi:26-hydroxylase
VQSTDEFLFLLPLQHEINDLISNLQNESSNAINMEDHIAVATSNVICNLLMSVRFTRDDPRFAKFNRMIEEGMVLFGQLFTVDYIPITQYLPAMRSAKDKIKVNRREMFEFYKEIIDDHRRTFDRDNIRDLVDAYLLEIEVAKEQGRSHELFEGMDHDTQIMQVMGDLFSAGMETIKTTLLWLMVFMIHNPDVKRKVQNELDNIVGRSRMPSTQDLPYLPFTESTIMEVMRMSSIVPLATTHSPIT